MDIDLSNLSHKEVVLDKVDPEQIYKKIIGIDRVGQITLSPFREEKNPSFSLYRNKSGVLCWKDFSSGESGDCITLVMKLNGVDFKGALDIITNMFNLSLDQPLSNYKYYKERFIASFIKRNKPIQITPRPFKWVDFNLWGQYGITVKTLKKFNVCVCNEVYLDGKLCMQYSNSNPVYAYKYDNRYKIYRPNASNKKYKWLNNTNSEIDISGFKQLPETGALLIITKSLKDVMVLYELGYNSIAFQSESQHIPKEVLSGLQQRFTEVILFYDNDEPGKYRTEQLVEEHKIRYIFVPELPGPIKDISDYVKHYGKPKGKELLEQLIHDTTCCN